MSYIKFIKFCTKFKSPLRAFDMNISLITAKSA